MTKKTKEKTAGRNITIGEFLTLLCAGQKITEPSNEAMHSGTIKAFDAYKPEGKVQGFRSLSGANRDEAFDSFGSHVNFEGLEMKLSRKEGKGGAIYRCIGFLGEVQKA